jgi:hypothetical protein
MTFWRQALKDDITVITETFDYEQAFKYTHANLTSLYALQRFLNLLFPAFSGAIIGIRELILRIIHYYMSLNK